MKSHIAGLAGAFVLAALGAPALAQQIPPVTDQQAATDCAPADAAAAIACLDRYLKPEVKAEIARSANPEALMPSEVYVGLWMRNQWGFWTGSPLAQYMLLKRVTQPEAQSNRIVQALWLRSKGCSFDPNNIGYVVAAMRKAGAGDDPCSVTVAEAETAGRNPMGANLAGGRARARGGDAAAAGAAPAARAGQAPQSGDAGDQYPED